MLIVVDRKNMLSVGIAQIPNSTDVSKNFEAIYGLLQKFETTNVDVILFPECSLSGFTSKMKECTDAVLNPYVEKVQSWVNRTGIEVVLPTAIVESEKVFNSGFWFKENECERFYKIGLTDSEKKFFSVPADERSKVFKIKGYNVAVLICFEIEHGPWTYFEKEQVDAILWPGYWGWKLEDTWTEKREQEKLNPIFKNMTAWQIPILQSNFACNDLDGHTGAGPEGLSFVVNSNNELIRKGAHLKSAGFIVSLDKVNGKTIVIGCGNDL